MTSMNNSTSKAALAAGPVLWVLVGAVLGGGGVYALGLSRGSSAVAVHVGEVRPAEPMAAPASMPVSNASAANAAPTAALAQAQATAAPAPGAAPTAAPRPASERIALKDASAPSEDGASSRTAAFAANAKKATAASRASSSMRAPEKPVPVVALRTAQAGGVHYGMASRSELMGRGAGPVYNLKGGGGAAGSAADVNTLIKQAATVVEGAQGAMDAAPMDDQTRSEMKARMQSATSGLQGSGQ